MLLIPVNSSAIAAVGYDGYTLAVVFTSSDRVYEHHSVPPWVYAALMTATSIGAYHSRNIRERYQ